MKHEGRNTIMNIKKIMTQVGISRVVVRKIWRRLL